MNPVLFGLLISEGSITLRERNRGKISFSNKQDVLHHKFIEAIKSLVNTKIKHRVNNTGVKETIIESGLLSRKILKEINSCRTRACESKPMCRHLKGKSEGCCLSLQHLIFNNQHFCKIIIPENILSDKEQICQMLQAISSGEGRVKLLPFEANNRIELIRKIEIGCKHPQLRIDLIKCLKKIGIKAREESDDRIVIEGKDHLKKFKEKVRFIESCKVLNGLWKGRSKNELLNVLIDTFGLDFTQFESKNDLINFITRLLEDKASVAGLASPQ